MTRAIRRKTTGPTARLRRLRRDRSGSAIIEFAILAPLFFAIMFSGFEAGLMYLKIGMVEHGMSEVSRMIYTGQASGSVTRKNVIDTFCDAVDSVINCDDNITLEVRRLQKYSDFEDTATTCRHTDEDFDDEPEYQPSVGGDIVFVRICVTTNLVVPSLKNMTFGIVNIGLRLPESADGRYSLSSSSVFRNEPF